MLSSASVCTAVRMLLLQGFDTLGSHCPEDRQWLSQQLLLLALVSQDFRLSNARMKQVTHSSLVISRTR